MTAQVDPAEIRRFSALSDQWWAPDGPLGQLHRMTPARMQIIRDALAPDTDDPVPLAGLSILDVGCGGGLLCEPLTRLGARVTGLDASPEAVEAARAHAGQSGLDITYRTGTLDDPEVAGPYDAVIASEVIEHVPDPAVLIAGIARVLRPGGTVVVTTLNRTGRSLFVAKLLAEYVLRLVPARTHDWRRFLTPSELSRLLAGAGFSVTATTGIVYRILRDRFEPGKDLSINYAVCARLER